MQHAAAQYNTLHHTATNSNTLQQTATHYNTGGGAHSGSSQGDRVELQSFSGGGHDAHHALHPGVDKRHGRGACMHVCKYIYMCV